MTDTKPPLPEPDTHCWDEDTQKDCWSYSEELTHAYADAAVSAERAHAWHPDAIAQLVTKAIDDERERCAKLCEEMGFVWAAATIRVTT